MTRRPQTRLGWLLVPALLLLQLVVPGVAATAPARAATGPGEMTLRVQSQISLTHPGETAQPITKYRWLVSAERTGGAYGYVPGADGKAGYDGTGDPTNSSSTFTKCTPGFGQGNVGAGYDPNNCQWPSVRYTPGAVPVVAQGDQSTFAPGSDGFATKRLGGLAPGRYLVSVTAKGHKIDGAHFDVDGGGSITNVVVSMHPYPLPLGTLRLRVFKDTAPVDGTYEAGIEAPLRGFTTHLGDPLGEVTTDYFGNPLCTNYVHENRLSSTDPNFTPAGGIPRAGYSTSNYDPTSPVVFDADGGATVDADDPGGRCLSDADGDVAIPNLGPNRYTASVVAPGGQRWYQTTTLEGNHDWDIWIAEGETGYDTEMTVGAEQVPPVSMGFVPYGSGDALPANGPSNLPAQSDQAPAAFPSGNTGAVTGTVVEINTYVGGVGGVPVPNGGVAGANIRGPVDKAIITLSDLDDNDQMVYVGRTATDGSFTIANVPDGSYQLTMWDVKQQMILDSFNVSVQGGRTTDVGQQGIVDWFTEIRGTVFLDANGNGKRDSGEQGVPKFPIGYKERDNSVMDAGQNAAQTNDQGNYVLREAYPISRWMILEAFSTKYKTTGVTVQADNETSPTTYRGAAVDLNVLPIIGLSGRVDWGVQTYASDENGGIAATVTYDTTRNELDPSFAATEPYQPGIPGLTMHLYYPLKDADGNVLKNPDGSARVLLGSDGTPLDIGGRDAEPDGTYTTETWDQPKGCTARQHDGTVLTDQAALPPAGDPNFICVEAPMMGWQGIPSDTTEGAFGSTVNGNYAFASLAFTAGQLATEAAAQAGQPAGTSGSLSDADALDADHAVAITNDDFVVKVEIPELADGTPLYLPTREEDVNIFDGDQRLPQENFPLASGYDVPDSAQADPVGGPISQGNGFPSPCVGKDHTVTVDDPYFLAGGGSPFEGKKQPLCDQKLITVRGGQAVAPNFNLFTEVPLPTHFWGLTINDLGLSQDRTQTGYGEAQPIPDIPMGVYDWSGRLVDTVSTDWNGMYEALEPSSSTYNCPTPSGLCTGMYYFKGNDPGQPGNVNANYNPRFRTIGTQFQAWPGLFTVTDTAPTQVGVIALGPGSTQANPVQCDVNAGTSTAVQKTPDIWTISKPYLVTGDPRSLTLKGTGFGAVKPTVRLTNGLGTVTTVAATAVTAFADGSVTFTVPTIANGPYSVSVTNATSGRTSVNGIGLHQLGGIYTPRLIQVNPPSTAIADQSSRSGNTTSPRLNFPSTAFPAVTNGDPNTNPENVLQRAVDQAATYGQALVVVWPNPTAQHNPTGDYFENLIVHSNVKIQGVGPGGGSGAGHVYGSRLNGLGFNPDNLAGAAWVAKVASLQYDGPANVPDSAVVTYLGRDTEFGAVFNAALDGFTVTGGSQADFVTNVNGTFGGANTPAGGPGALVTQGGGIYLHASANNLLIANNVIVGNSGSYAGGIRLGTPYTAVETSANTWVTPVINRNVTIRNNRIRDNGGTNLAGGIGIFDGSNNYTIDHNDLCGNFSAEYGGGISHYGLSNSGLIQANRVYLNQSYDEGGGVMMAGELNPNLTEPSAGAGTNLDIDANLIQDNLANDDGGGLRFLQAGTRQVDVTNNIVNNNISTHEGGGIALDDSTNVHITGNTVMKNITTATAITSNGQPAPAGLSTASNSDQLQATLGPAQPRYSLPRDFRDNIIWGNLAGTWDPTTGTVKGIDAASPSGNPKRVWEMGSLDAGVTLTPTFSILTQYDAGVTPAASNRLGTATNFPQVKSPYEVGVQVITARFFPAFREAVIVVNPVAPNVQGDYHLTGSSSPAFRSGGNIQADTGVATQVKVLMTHDVDLGPRPVPAGTPIEIGADEIP